MRFGFLLLLAFQAALAQTWSHYTTGNAGLPSDQVTSVCVDNMNNKWFGTNRGLVCYDGSNWRVYKQTAEKQTLASDFINDLAFEITGYGPELWAATQNGVSVMAISVLDAVTFATPYRTDNTGLVSNTVRSVTVDAGHVRWFGTNAGLSSFDGDGWGSYTFENFWIFHNNVKSLASGPDSMVYIGTEGTGVSRLKMHPLDGITAASPIDKTWSGIDEPELGKLVSDSVYAILIEADGRQWFGTDHGLCLHTSYDTRRDWTVFSVDDGMLSDFIHSVCRDHGGNLWIGTKAGASVYNGSGWVNYTRENGLSGTVVFDIAVDQNGEIWLATDNGITRRYFPVEVETNPVQPRVKTLHVQNYPNPFNLKTRIFFSVPDAGPVRLKIYNILGQQIFSYEKYLPAGEYSVFWMGRDKRGLIVNSGLYLAVLTAGGRQSTCKIVLSK